MGGSKQLRNSLTGGGIKRPPPVKGPKGYDPPQVDLKDLNLPKEAQENLLKTLAWDGGGGGGGRGGKGIEWEDIVKGGEKALDNVIKQCLVILALKMKDIVGKIKSIEEDDLLPMGTKRALMNSAVRADGEKALKDFDNCLQKNFGGAQALLMAELGDQLLSMAKDDLMNRFGVNVSAIDEVLSKAERMGGGGNNARE